MKLNWILMLLLVPMVLAQEEALLKLKDITNDRIIDDVAVYVTADDITYTYFLPKDGVLSLADIDLNSEIIIKADDFSTDGNDYYQVFQQGAIAPGTGNVYLMPVCSVKGMVKDDLNNIVPNARLKFDCRNDHFSFPSQADEFGSFFLDYLPKGECTIHASYKNATGIYTLQTEQGELTQVEIMLDRSIIVEEDHNQESSLVIRLMLFVLIVAFIIFAVFKLNQKDKQSRQKNQEEQRSQSKPQSQNQQAEQIDSACQKIMKTFNDKERKVVHYLMEHKHHAHQSAVRHATSIPRTSLARVVDSLERKNIITVDKEGKIVRLTLTRFFLGKG